MIPVESSWIAGVDYDGRNLFVFLRDGRVYTFPDQPVEVFLAMLAAESKGHFYNRHLRRRRASRWRRW
jgi:hypothetical protein